MTTTPRPVNENPERRCSGCGREKPIGDFPPDHRVPSGLSRRCRVCIRERKRRAEIARQDPESVHAVNRAVAAAPDREPAVRLREELALRRARAEAFGAAWSAAVAAAVAPLSPDQRVEWSRAFSSTRAAWATAYGRESTGSPSLFLVDEPHADSAQLAA